MPHGAIMETLDDNSFECFTCSRIFTGRVHEITREWERTDFGGELPEIEIVGSCGLECYCSRSCLDARCRLVMANEGLWPAVSV
jgi:hypothetical protein